MRERLLVRSVHDSMVASKLEEVLARSDMKHLKTSLCGYRTFSDVFDATAWQHLHPEMQKECEPQKLRAVMYAASSAGLALAP